MFSTHRRVVPLIHALRRIIYLFYYSTHMFPSQIKCICNRYAQDELTALRERRSEVDGNYRNDMSEVAQLSGIQVGVRGIGV